MAISGLAVTVDRTSYARVESGRSVVTARITPTGSGGDVTVTLRRRSASGERTLASQTQVTPAGAFAVAFDLTTLVDADGFLLARRGTYRVVAEVVGGGVSGTSPDFAVVLITPEVMRTRWALGLPLYAVESLMVRTQPVNVTGVTVQQVSRTSALGAGTLAWVFAAKTLAWRGGTAIAVNMTSRGAYTLPDTAGEYMVVDVDPALLPGTNASDALLVDYATLTDDRLLEIIRDTTDTIERGLKVRLEPTRVVSRQLVKHGLATEYDDVIDGVAWYRPMDVYRFLSIKLPLARVEHVYSLTGWFNESKVVEIPANWFVVNSLMGHIELVPSNIATLQWYYYGPWMPNLLAAQGTVAQFWQFDVVAGLREIPPGLIQFIAKRAAIEVLTIAGQARYPAGVAGFSISRDGVSESTSLIPGIYGATIRQYQDDTGLGRLPGTWNEESWGESLRGFVGVVL